MLPSIGQGIDWWHVYSRVPMPRRISYPFLHADRIKTPTLFLGGEHDFNVPVQGGQQMHQALRSLGIDTQLIITPTRIAVSSVPAISAIAWSATSPGTTSI